MNILLTGATGFIGQAVHQTLVAQGHTVVRAVRSPQSASDIAVDFERDTQPSVWLPRLKGIDAIINTVGILGGGEAQMAALHCDTPTALAQAAAQSGVARWVQVSTLGSDGDLATRYFLSKRAGELGIRSALPQAHILRPSLVFGQSGASSQLFMRLTKMPFLCLPDAGRMLVQPVHVADVAQAVVALLQHSQPQTVNAVGAKPMTMANYLKSLTAQLRRTAPFKLQAVLPLPLFAAQASAKLGDYLPQQLWTTESLAMLREGNSGDAAPFIALLGRAPIAVEGFVKHE